MSFRSPYKWRSGVNVLKRNSVRLAEVWLDEYKQYYYERINNQLVCASLTIAYEYDSRETLVMSLIAELCAIIFSASLSSGISTTFSPNSLFLESRWRRERYVVSCAPSSLQIWGVLFFPQSNS